MEERHKYVIENGEGIHQFWIRASTEEVNHLLTLRLDYLRARKAFNWKYNFFVRKNDSRRKPTGICKLDNYLMVEL